MAGFIRWRSFVMGTAVLAGTMAAAPAAFAQVVPGTGSLINTDDFEDSKFSWIHNWPKSSKEEDEQIRHPLGGATNKRWFESPKRGSPDVLKWIETPPGGLEGSKGALYVRTRDSGIPGHPGRKQAQDDFILAAKPTTPAYQPNYTVRVFVPEWSQWEQRNGVSFGIRAGMQGPYEKEEEVNSVRRFFRGGKRMEKVTVTEPYYPGFFIQFNPKSMPGNKEGDHALILIRADSLGHEVPGPKIMQPGWWTIGMSVSPDSRCHFFASPGVDDLTAADHIYSSLPYGIPGKTFNTIFFNICSVDDGQTWSTPWIIDDPKVFIVDGRTPRQAPIAQQPKPIRTAALPTPPVQPLAPPPAQPAPAAVIPPAAPVSAVVAPPAQPAPLPIPAAPAAVIPAPAAVPPPAQASAAPTAPAGKPVVGEPLPPSESYGPPAAPVQQAQQPASAVQQPAPVAQQPAMQQPQRPMAQPQQPQRPIAQPMQQRPVAQPQQAQRPAAQPQQRPVAQPQQRPGVPQPQRPVAQQPLRPGVAPMAPVAAPPAVVPMPAAPAAATPVTVPAPAPMQPATVSIPPAVTPVPMPKVPAPIAPAPIVQTPAPAPFLPAAPMAPVPAAAPVATVPAPMPIASTPVLVPAVVAPIAPPAAPMIVAVPMTTPAPVAVTPAPMAPAPLPAVPMTAASGPIPLVIPPVAPVAPALVAPPVAPAVVPPPVKPAPAAQPPKLFSAEDFITPPPRDSLPPAPPKVQ
jgi:hypothetical protein